jgi:predicted secreted acid phosphatase
VLDIDETALSNWDIIKRDDFGRPIGGPCEIALDAPCGWAAWDQLGRDPAIMPTLGVFQQARALNVTVFFITGRPESQREATERNLVAAGYAGYSKLYMVPNGARFASAVDFKAPVRAQIEEAGYTIIANIGAQPSDLPGGHGRRVASHDRRAAGEGPESVPDPPGVATRTVRDDASRHFAGGLIVIVSSPTPSISHSSLSPATVAATPEGCRS